MHLSRPEDYFSIYQSGCNHNCLKCHSWEFSKIFNGDWYSTDEIALECRKYEQDVTPNQVLSGKSDFGSNLFQCPHCRSNNTDLIKGKSIMIKNIKIK